MYSLNSYTCAYLREVERDLLRDFWGDREREGDRLRLLWGLLDLPGDSEGDLLDLPPLPAHPSPCQHQQKM